jgi:protein gp37
MADKSTIEWTDATWNPIRGCSRVSEGCRNCYAERVAIRFNGPGQAYDGLAKITNGHPQWTGKVAFIQEHLHDPLKWKEPRRIFVNSMSDLFHESLSDNHIAAIFLTMAACAEDSTVRKMKGTGAHTFQILTKRPLRMLNFINEFKFPSGKTLADTPLPNVWLGVSVENQKAADERIPLLLSTPAAVRWISAEPLLGPIDLERIAVKLSNPRPDLGDPTHASALFDHAGDTAKVGWVVAGGESGPGARPMHPDWARSLRDQCKSAGVAFFFKQWGEWLPALVHSGGLATSWSAANDQKFGKDFKMLGRVYSEGNPLFDDRKFDSLQMQDDCTMMIRVGKKAAGRLLDGVEHNEYPEYPEANRG